MTDIGDHLHALQEQLDTAQSAIAQAAANARAAIDGDLIALHEMTGIEDRPPILAGVPVDEPPAYIPPPLESSENALIPDSPLIDSPVVPSSLAFDDAPLWQS